MTSATFHRTSSLAIPSTQNTALVLEFRCLYTHDLRRKSKRWQDGFLRFHTFNKRIMVYDVPRNFIGDSHWREDAAIQDGDEMQLEKGVLIQVGEAIGKVEQDLTALFEKRKPASERNPDHRSPPRSSYAANDGSMATPSAQLRPKTLNALLGTPRGTYGRAIIPSKSPYQERYLKSVQPDNELPPAKRRKGESQYVQNVGIIANTPIKRKQPAFCNSVCRPITNSTADSTDLAVGQKRRAVDLTILDSDEENSLQLACLDADRRTLLGSQQTFPRAGLPSGKNRSVLKTTKENLPSVPIQLRTSHESGAGYEAVEPLRVSENHNDVKQMNPLRFASTKPRKKLMYKELLPQWPPSEAAPELIDPPISFDGKSMSRRSEDDLQACQVDDLSKFHQAQRERLEARLETRRHQRSVKASIGSLSTEGYSQDLLSQPDADLLHKAQPATQHLLKVSTARLGDKVEQFTCFDNNSYETRDSVKAHALESNQIHALSHTTPKLAEQDTEAHKLSQLDEILMTNKTRRQTSITRAEPPILGATDIKSFQSHASKQRASKTPLLRQPRTVSDPPSLYKSKSPGPSTLKAPLPQLESMRPRSPLKKSRSETSRNPRAPVPRERQPPQRAVSDLTGLRRVATTIPSESLLPDDKDLDLGPWSREAFDLWGWRPGTRAD